MIRQGHVTQGQWFNQFRFGPVNWRLVMQHVIFIGQYNTDPFDSPIWSLVYEMRISLVFPLLCAIVLRLKPAQSLIMAACMSCLSILTLILLPPPHFNIGTVSTLHYAALFIVGIYLARQKSIISNIFAHLSKRKKEAIAVLAALLYLYAAAGITRRLTHYGLVLSSDWFTALGAAGLIVFSLNSASCRRVLLWPPIHALGKMSYSVHLLHLIIMQLLIHLLYGKIPLLFVIALCLVAVVAGSWAFYRLIELPFMNLGRRLGGYLTSKIKQPDSAALT
jgi:peptidoglycan/LPS O-acetylase OafA/YrhL